MDKLLYSMILLIVVALIIYFEVPPLLKAKRWLDITVFSVLLILGTAMMSFWIFDIRIPAPFKALGVY